MTKRHAPAAARNRAPIADVLASALPPSGEVLEVASGTGEHVVYFGGRFPDLVWQPSDADPDMLASQRAHIAEAGVSNVRDPIVLDAAADTWPIDRADAIVCINMIHISPWEACLGLLAGAERLLPSGGLLALYGPYRIAGRATAPSNEAFDDSLRARDPRWGLRELGEVEREAARYGFSLEQVVDMPANNVTVLFRQG